ncbi:TPA: transposase [Burkholderia vietnamiensis]|nr:transposase [Burkholderia vietnamiensis]
MQLTYRFRIKDKHSAELRRQSKAVNFVWNFCRETQQHALKWNKRWPSWGDLQKLTAGSSKELDLHAHTIQQVCQRYAKARDQQRRPLLRWRGRKSLGWVPFNNGHIRFDGECFVFRGVRYAAWVSREIEVGATFGAGSFSQDAQGHWYINLPVECEHEKSSATSGVGVDLGLKDIASLSTGRKIEHPRWYRAIEKRLAVAQRANKKKQVKKLHAKAANQRADFLHKESLRIVREHGAIFVGNVSAKAFAKSNMSKSSLDAGWAMFKGQLEYKAIARGVIFAEVNEAWSTQTCSSCGSVEGPKGVAGLGIREWMCSCGAVLDRDTNAAQNILRRGLATLAEGA